MSVAIPGVINIRDGEFWNETNCHLLSPPKGVVCMGCYNAVQEHFLGDRPEYANEMEEDDDGD